MRVRIEDPSADEHGQEGTVLHRLDGVWIDLVKVELDSGQILTVHDDHFEEIQ
jgi:hypothetical protein